MIPLGNNLAAERDHNQVTVYKFGGLLKRVDISKAVNRRLFIVELVNDLGAHPSKVAQALQISRQSVYNNLDSYKQYGLGGLLHSQKRGVGNKARLHEQRRKLARQAAIDKQTVLQLAAEPPENFAQAHDWQRSRYAGGLIFSTILEKDWHFMPFFASVYGKLVNVFLLFAQMLVHNIESIEQLKAVKIQELGLVCGLRHTPSPTTFSKWLKVVVRKAQAVALIKQFFLNQIAAGLVSCYLLYADGHFIPYTGKEKVHKGYSTQRRLAMPGQTNIVFHDATGRIVYFQLEEGSGDLSQAIEDISAEVRNHFGESFSPLVISDRGSWGVEHFHRMSQYRLLTWEKHTDEAEIGALPADLFSEPLTVNQQRYRFYEFPAKQTYWDTDKTVSVELRRIVIWNLGTDRRPVCVSNDTLEDTIFLGQAMLGRWGNSENGFKYIAQRFNPHYIPLLQAAQESEQQETANPVFKELTGQKQKVKKRLQSNANQLAVTEESYNKDGTPRFNSKRQRLLKERTKLKGELEAIGRQLQTTPERVTLAEATQGRESFKVIDSEAKNLFDLVQAMVWNARRTLIDLLRNHYHDERDVVNLLDHITACQGWIKSSSQVIYVRLEPMDLPRYRSAQKEFCDSLNNLKPRLPNGKILKFSVGSVPNQQSVQKSGTILS